MANEREMALAKSTYDALCKTLDANEWKYSRRDENLVIESGVASEDLPIKFILKVDANRQVVLLRSLLPFTIAEDKRLDIAVAVCAVNARLVWGSFDFSVASGDLMFRMPTSFKESVLGSDVFAQMIAGSCTLIEEYNDKFFMISKGMLSLEQFLASLDD